MKDGYDLADEMFEKIGKQEDHLPTFDDALMIISFWGYNEVAIRGSKIGFVCYAAREKIRKTIEHALVYGDFKMYEEFEKYIRNIKEYTDATGKTLADKFKESE